MRARRLPKISHRCNVVILIRVLGQIKVRLCVERVGDASGRALLRGRQRCRRRLLAMRMLMRKFKPLPELMQRRLLMRTRRLVLRSSSSRMGLRELLW